MSTTEHPNKMPGSLSIPNSLMEKPVKGSVSRHVLNKIDIFSKPCQPHSHDILFGRGLGVGNHLGNMYYRQLVVPEKPRYKEAASRKEGRQVASYIINAIRRLDPPGRFLVPDSPNQMTWFVARENRVMLKTCQALRETHECKKDMFFTDVRVVDNKLCVFPKKRCFVDSLTEDLRLTAKVSLNGDCLSASDSHATETSMDAVALDEPRDNTIHQNSDVIISASYAPKEEDSREQRRSAEGTAGSAASGNENSNLSIFHQSASVLNQAVQSSHPPQSKFPAVQMGSCASNFIPMNEVENNASEEINPGPVIEQPFSLGLNHNTSMEEPAMKLLFRTIQEKWKKEQLAQELIYLLGSKTVVKNNNAHGVHKLAPQVDEAFMHKTEDGSQAESPPSSDSYGIDVDSNRLRKISSSAPVSVQNSYSANDMGNLLKLKQIKNTTQVYSQIPETCMSSVSSLTSGEEPSTCFNQVQSEKSKKTTFFAIAHASLMKLEESSVAQCKPNASRHYNKLGECHTYNMKMDSGKEYHCSKVISQPLSVISCDDARNSQKQRASENLSDGGKIQNSYKTFIMPLSYIGKSFSGYRLNGLHSVTDETKVVLEELIELKDKGEGAALHLPSVVGSLCQRIIDLEELLSP